MNSLTKFITICCSIIFSLGCKCAYADLLTAHTAYERGEFQTAFAEYKTLADQGNSTAQASLGALYEGGEGVAKDLEKARYWYEQSAQQGNDNGQYRLGSLYFVGNGVERDMVTACTWFSLATYSGHGAARNSMQFCARDLNEKQRNEYFERAQAWLAARKK